MKMKVYIVVKHYSDWDSNKYEILKVFRSKIDAENYLNRLEILRSEIIEKYKVYDNFTFDTEDDEYIFRKRFNIADNTSFYIFEPELI